MTRTSGRDPRVERRLRRPRPGALVRHRHVPARQPCHHGHHSRRARVPFLRDPFGADITTVGLLIADVRVTYKDQLRLADSPLQVTIWTKRLRAVDFTLGYEVRSVNADPQSNRPSSLSRSWPPFTLKRSGWCDWRLQIGITAAVDSVAERGLWLGPGRWAAHRADLATFVDHALRLDDAAVIRIRARSSGLLTAWVATGFDVLASRVVVGRVLPPHVGRRRRLGARAGRRRRHRRVRQPGLCDGLAWRGGLPPDPASPTSTTYRPR